MANDWSDPEQVERELRRRERAEAPGDDAPSDMRLLLAAMHAVLEAQKRTGTQTDTLTEDIAALRGLLDRREPACSAEDAPASESALAQRLAEAEGRIAGHVDHLAERVRDVAGTPKALENFSAAVRTLDEAVRAQTRVTEANASFMDRMSVDLKDMVRDADLGMRHRFAEVAKGVRDALQETAAVVLKRRRRDGMSRLSIAVGALLVVLFCVGGGVWLQSEHGLAPAHDPTGGWRDYIWNQYGSAVQGLRAQSARGQSPGGLPAPGDAATDVDGERSECTHDAARG